MLKRNRLHTRMRERRRWCWCSDMIPAHGVTAIRVLVAVFNTASWYTFVAALGEITSVLTAHHAGSALEVQRTLSRTQCLLCPSRTQR